LPPGRARHSIGAETIRNRINAGEEKERPKAKTKNWRTARFHANLFFYHELLLVDKLENRNKTIFLRNISIFKLHSTALRGPHARHPSGNLPYVLPGKPNKF